MLHRIRSRFSTSGSMRVFAVSNSQRFLVLVLTILLALTIQTAHATNRSHPKVVRVNEVFIVEENGKSYTCALVGNRWLSGTLKSGNKFISDNARIKALKNSISRASDPLLNRLKKKLAKEKKKRKIGKRLCEQGPPPAAPAPPPDPLRVLSRSMTPSDIQHLFRRAALGYVPPASMQLGLNYGVGALVNDLFRVRNDAQAEQIARSWLSAGNLDGRTRETGVKYYALLKLILTQNPLRNHLCMIHLHDIIPVSVSVLNTSSSKLELILRYFDTLCSIANNKSYRDLVKEITIDPAMLYWLDGATNNKLQPNENYARELMELFTVGVFNGSGAPNYTDLDVATAARALTGLGVINTEEFGYSTIFNFSAFDNAPHKMMFRGTAHEGSVYDWESIVDYIFDHHPNTAYNLARMLAERYVHPDITKTNRALVLALARDLKTNNYNLMSTLGKLLMSEAFYDSANKHTILRSPAELTVQMFRMLRSTGAPIDISPFTPSNILAIASQGGHTLAEPPTVFGWDRHKEFTIGSRFMSVANRITSILGSGTLNNEDNPTGWNYFDLYPPGNTMPTAHQQVDHMLNLVGVTINSVQRAMLIRYLNSQLRQTSVNGQTVIEEVDDPWDPTRYSQARRKLSGLLRILLGMRAYRVY